MKRAFQEKNKSWMFTKLKDTQVGWTRHVTVVWFRTGHVGSQRWSRWRLILNHACAYITVHKCTSVRVRMHFGVLSVAICGGIITQILHLNRAFSSGYTRFVPAAFNVPAVQSWTTGTDDEAPFTFQSKKGQRRCWGQGQTKKKQNFRSWTYFSG